MGSPPDLGPALLVGIGSVAAPFLVMQPGMGAGIAASRTPRPAAARLQSLVTHAIFGLGLYAAGWLAIDSVCRISMRIPNRFAPILFGALLSAIMVAIVSAFVLAINQGIHQGFSWQWLRSCVTTWPVAFPTVTSWRPGCVGRLVG